MKKLFWILVAACSFSLTTCDNNDELWDAVNDLKSRVKALETQVAALNDNIKALQELYSGATISSVVENDGTYVITLSDGTSITLTQGSEAEAVMPIIGISEDGMWQVSYDGGKTFTKLGNAVAEDGKTPTFRINDSGYWEISYDGGKTFETVKDTNGKPVSAIGNTALKDKFFEEVIAYDDYLYIKLLDGTELNIPITKDFYCRFVGVEGVQLFAPASEKNFSMEIKGAGDVIITVPAGWKAILSEPSADFKAVLTVTAPSGSTRALADTSKDIAVEAISSQGFACVAKMQVECEGTVTPTPPSIAAVASASVAATETSLSFDVTPSADTDSWKYLILTKSEAESQQNTLTAEYIAENGTLGTTLTVTCENLTADTDYIFYVVAIKGSAPALYSDVIAIEGKTLAEPIDPNDYSSIGVTVNGVTYDKNSEGATIVQVAADATAHTYINVAAGGVLFIDDKSSAFNAGIEKSAGVVKDLVIVGRYIDKKANFDMTYYLSLRNPEGTLAFKNLNIDATGNTGNYIFNAVNSGEDVGGMKNLVFEDCDISFSKTFLTFYNAATTTGVENIIFRNCKLRYVRESEGSEKSYSLFTTQKIDGGLSTFKSLIFDNNVIYTTTPGLEIACNILYQDNAANQASLSGSLENLDIVFTNNTMVDFISFGSSKGSSFFHVGKFKSINFTNNLMYSSRTDKYPTAMRVETDYASAWPSVTMDRTASRGYGTAGWKLFHNYKPVEITTNTFVKIAADKTVFTSTDYNTGTFVKASEFEAFGSTLK